MGQVACILHRGGEEHFALHIHHDERQHFFCPASGPPVCLRKEGEGRDTDVGLGLGAASFPRPLSKEHLMDTSRLKNILPLPRQTTTTDQKAEQGKEGPTPICKQISAMQPLPPSFIKMNCSGVGWKRVYRTRITPLIPQLPISSAHAAPCMQLL